MNLSDLLLKGGKIENHQCRMKRYTSNCIPFHEQLVLTCRLKAAYTTVTTTGNCINMNVYKP
jgi:hypothetical protein